MLKIEVLSCFFFLSKLRMKVFLLFKGFDFIFRQRLTQRSYTTVLSGDNSSLKYNDEVSASEETQISKDHEERQFVPLPDDYPASLFWKNYDFRVTEKDFAYICKIMYQEIFGRKNIALDRFHEFMACVQQKGMYVIVQCYKMFYTLKIILTFNFY